jgi:hypothetical protein
MGTIPAPKLLDKWKLQQLTVEMAAGHTLQHLVMLHDNDHEANRQRHRILKALEEIQTSLRNLRTDVDGLIAHTGMSYTPVKRKPGRPQKTET